MQTRFADIDKKWFVIFKYTINYLSFGYVRLPKLEYYCISDFSCFASFFLLFFLFFLRLSTYKPLDALYSKLERLKILGRTSARMKLGVPG